MAGNRTFVVATDRVELDDQIAKTFKACGAVSEAESDECHAASGAHLRELLNRIKLLLVLNWRQKSSARSQLKLAIEGVLDTGLPGGLSA